MYKTIVKYKYMDDKTTLKIVVPIIAWLIIFMIILIIFARGMYLLFPIMILEFLCCIPIIIFCLKNNNVILHFYFSIFSGTHKEITPTPTPYL